MRISTLLLCLALSLGARLPLSAQDPGAQQDAEAAREKLLKAADQLDNIQANSEATKTSVDGIKTDVASLQGTVTKLQSDNATLRQQLTDLQAALDQFKAEQLKARQTLIDNVADMIAAEKASEPTKVPRKKKAVSDSDGTTDLSPSMKSSPTPTSHAELNAETPATTSNDSIASSPSSAATDESPVPTKPRKGYYHVVADGETLTLICAAYRGEGVNITVSQIRKANGLTEKSALKAGQKLFIPKPGT